MSLSLPKLQLIQLILSHSHSQNQQLTGLKAQLQQSNDQNVDMLRGLGVDPCKVYKEAHVQRVVDHIEHRA